jgi:8-oxo-dGTP pyrophosphatase MutT (NUDIX family)
MRELREETGLHPTSAHYIGSFDGGANHHKAFVIEATGHVHVDHHEVGDHVWWDRRSNLPVNEHVHAILRMLGH